MSNLILLLLASIGPGLLWLLYFYKQDRYEPEPVKLVLKIFAAGLLLVIPAGMLEQIWRGQILSAVRNGNWPAFLVMAFLVIALIEEGLKSGFLWWLIGKNRELDEPADGIIYGITLGLGFASLENFLWASAFGFGVAVLRAVITTLAHASFTGWMGYYIARYKLEAGPEGYSRNNYLLGAGFFIAYLAHGAYDFLLFLRSPVASILAVFLIGYLLIRLYLILRLEVARSPFRR
ncbi:MAG TPA: PrsW family glutamic-type intramembrane protease [Bacillota bacterium]|nr:PrsW family glutamic-type intramembrane protease [Bacillota bacterium]